MSTLDHIFGTRERMAALRFFLFHPDVDYTAVELKKKLGRLTPTARQLRELLHAGSLLEGVRQGSGETTYQMNTSWLLFQEFRALFVKAQLLVERDLVNKLQQTGKVRLLILAGVFVGDRGSPTDILIVGTINHAKVTRLLRSFERDLDQEVNFTVLTVNEYKFRKNVGDRFLYHILEHRHLVVADTIDRPQRKKKVEVRKKDTSLKKKNAKKSAKKK